MYTKLILSISVVLCKLVLDVLFSLKGQVCIPIRAPDIPMSEKIFDIFNISPSGEQIGAECVTQIMKMKPLHACLVPHSEVAPKTPLYKL